jgi:hypothetical protein
MSFQLQKGWQGRDLCCGGGCFAISVDLVFLVGGNLLSAAALTCLLGARRAFQTCLEPVLNLFHFSLLVRHPFVSSSHAVVSFRQKCFQAAFGFEMNCAPPLITRQKATFKIETSAARDTYFTQTQPKNTFNIEKKASSSSPPPDDNKATTSSVIF